MLMECMCMSVHVCACVSVRKKALSLFRKKIRADRKAYSCTVDRKLNSLRPVPQTMYTEGKSFPI